MCARLNSIVQTRTEFGDPPVANSIRVRRMERYENSISAPTITEMQVIPVAGHDSMLLNLSGAHSPFFTRNLVILKDNAGHSGVGEVPGGEPIRKTLVDSRALVVGQLIG